MFDIVVKQKIAGDMLMLSEVMEIASSLDIREGEEGLPIKIYAKRAGTAAIGFRSERAAGMPAFQEAVSLAEDILDDRGLNSAPVTFARDGLTMLYIPAAEEKEKETGQKKDDGTDTGSLHWMYSIEEMKLSGTLQAETKEEAEQKVKERHTDIQDIDLLTVLVWQI